MDGEQVDSTLSPSDRDSEVVLLTNKRVIHLNGNSRDRLATFASLEDIDAVEIKAEPRGSSGLIWAALAFLVAIALYAAIDHPLGRIVAPIAVAVMGLYLVIDHVTARGRPLVVFSAGSSQVRCGLTTEQAADDIHGFVNRLFQLKEQNGRSAHYRRFLSL